MQDQRQYWDKAHASRELSAHSLSQTSFAEEVNRAIPPNSAMLELGCGEGNDSIYFAEQGHKVEATDFSDIAIEKNRRNLSNINLRLKTVDTSQPLPYPDGSFDVVYARLSLHYFTDEITAKIFAEISRVLKPGGQVCFMCKSVEDKLYGQGERIEPDMFELDGHVRHFFSVSYAQKLLADNGFQIQKIEKGQEKLYERQAAFIKVIAKKTA
jgi:ubiquinone/menaquinone biosynthesis C-methylase UbiE